MKLQNALLAAATLLSCSAANAGLLFDPVTVHPAEPQRSQPFLLLVESAWSSGCGGTLRVQATAQRIDVIADESAAADRICTTVVVPFVELVNPADSLPPNAAFDAKVLVRYVLRSGGTMPDRELDRDEINFSTQAPPAVELMAGSFVTDALQASGLFVDRQDHVLSALLSDYDAQGRSSWRVGAGMLHGNVFQGEFPRYQTVQCIQAPCPRALPATPGTIRMLIRNQNELVVSFKDVFADPLTVNYRRFVFTRSAELPKPNEPGAFVPDLSGEWLVGLLGNNTINAEIRRYNVRFTGEVQADSGLDRFRYTVDSIGSRSDRFEIICSDERPVDGIVGCQVLGLRSLDGQCDSFFVPEDVVNGQLRTPASCKTNAGEIDTEFFMQRIER
jgi:hypothetical protein